MKAVLGKTTLDQMKSKILSNEVSQLVFDVYITPAQFAELVTIYNEEDFELIIKPLNNDR